MKITTHEIMTTLKLAPHLSTTVREWVMGTCIPVQRQSNPERSGYNRGLITITDAQRLEVSTQGAYQNNNGTNKIQEIVLKNLMHRISTEYNLALNKTQNNFASRLWKSYQTQISQKQTLIICRNPRKNKKKRAKSTKIKHK